MHDVAHLEHAGLACVAVLSDAFKPQAAFQANALGCPTAPRVFVKHPISNIPPAAVRCRAEEATDDIISALTDPSFVPADLMDSLPKVEPAQQRRTSPSVSLSSAKNDACTA